MTENKGLEDANLLLAKVLIDKIILDSNHCREIMKDEEVRYGYGIKDLPWTSSVSKKARAQVIKHSRNGI